MRTRIEHNAEDVARALGLRPDLIMGKVDRKLERGGHEVTREAERRAPKANSQLANAIHLVKYGQADYGVEAPTDYAVMQERGTRRGAGPSQQSMLDWIKVKHITPRDPDMDLEDLAFVIGQSIHFKGTKAQPFMEPALRVKRDRLTELVRSGVMEGLV